MPAENGRGLHEQGSFTPSWRDSRGENNREAPPGRPADAAGLEASISACARSERCPEGGYRRFAATSLAAFSMNAATDFGCDT
jgi:hypothetical protein